ncbi:hypothetical protein [Massilia sp. DWR3-1-1]|uniref:hypothetical protein n=1 Tax=Massilia sp. DWR3-1-1 TaxID=2804559 RepID=UPI003CEBED06
MNHFLRLTPYLLLSVAVAAFFARLIYLYRARRSRARWRTQRSNSGGTPADAPAFDDFGRTPIPTVGSTSDAPSHAAPSTWQFSGGGGGSFDGGGASGDWASAPADSGSSGSSDSGGGGGGGGSSD